MTWELMLLLVHLPFLFMAIALYPRHGAPGCTCWMQKIVMGVLVLTMAFMVIGYGLSALTSGEHGGGILLLGLLAGHVSNLLLLFRLTWQNPAWKLSFPPSQPSPAR